MTSETLLSVRVAPRSSRNRHEVEADGTVRLWLTAPPVEGAANKAVLRYLADVFDLPPTSLQIVLGHSARSKRVRIPLPPEEVARLLGENQKRTSE